jgi:hypothetical protein
MSTQEEMKAKMDIHQEKMQATIPSILSKSEETKHRVEDILSCLDQKTQGLYKELTKKTDETQVDLQVVKMSTDTWTGSNLVKDENSNLLADSRNTFNRCKNCFSLLLNVQRVMLER